MKLSVTVLLLFVIGYYYYKLVLLVIKMKQSAVLPTTNEEMVAIRIYPQKTVDPPIISKQKVGLMVNFLILLCFMIVLVIGTVNQNIDWPIFLLFIPILFNSNNLLNLFAVVDDGLICGSRFIAWKKIKSFHFISINTNHKFYGYSKEANDGYELKIRTMCFSTSCIVTSEEMKEKLKKILTDHVIVSESVQNL